MSSGGVRTGGVKTGGTEPKNRGAGEVGFSVQEYQVKEYHGDIIEMMKDTIFDKSGGRNRGENLYSLRIEPCGQRPQRRFETRSRSTLVNKVGGRYVSGRFDCKSWQVNSIISLGNTGKRRQGMG